jgi:hypothetical protein
MKRDPTGAADAAEAADPEETRRRLTSEVAELEGAMALVASGSASRITLSGLRFGEQLARRFRAEATSRGLVLDPILWPEDAGCDLIVRRVDD